MMAIKPPYALNGCHVLEAYDRYEDLLVTWVEPDRDLRMSKPLLAERFCRLKRLCEPKAFSALALIWIVSNFVTDERRALAGFPCCPPDPVTSRLLAVAFTASDRIELARARYESALGGPQAPKKTGMYRQRTSRFSDAGETFGLVVLEDETDKAGGKRVHATPKLNELILGAGEDVAMLAAVRLQSELSSFIDPGADGSR